MLKAKTPADRSNLIVYALAALAVALLWLAGLTQVKFDRSQAAKAAITQNSLRAEAFREYVLRTVDVANVVLRHTILAYGSVKSVKALLRDPAFASAPFAAVTIQSRGTVIASTTLPAPLLPASVDLAATKAEYAGRPYVSVPLHVTGHTVPLIAIVSQFKIDNEDALAIAWIEPSHFTKFATGAHFRPDDRLSLVGLDGITRARLSGTILSSGQDLSGSLVMRMQLANPNAQYLGPGALDGKWRYFSLRRLAGYPLFVASGMTQADVLSSPNSRQKIYFAALMLLTILTFLGVWLLLDRTERRRREVAQLAQSNRRLVQAQQIASMGEWDYDSAGDRLVWSETLCRMYGRRPDEAVLSLRDVERYVDKSDAKRIRRNLERVLKTGQSESYNLTVTLPDGTTAERHIEAVAERNANGEIIGVHGTDQDITERRRLEQLEARLENIARGDAMNALAATLAHELNQPLSAASNYLGAAMRILQTRGDIDRLTECIALASEQIHNTGDIIKGARELVANHNPELAPTSLQKGIEESVALLDRLKGAHQAELEVALDPTLDLVLARPAQLRQVFFNLLKNAIEAVGPMCEPQIRITSSRQSADCVAIQVSDNGTGMKAKLDPFSALFTTKAAGLGLGLSIARTIVEASGGKIRVLQTNKTGTTIEIVLKLAKATSDPS